MSRITNSMMANNLMYDLNQNKLNVNKWGRQMSTLRKINKLSDDPIGLVLSSQASGRLARIQHYQTNLETAKARIKTVESNITSINDIVKRTYELMVQATTDVNAPLDRAALAKEINALKESVLQILNTKEGDKYVFAGYNTLKRPFMVDVDGQIHYNSYPMTSDSYFLDDSNGIPEAFQIPTIDVGYNGAYIEVSVTGYRLAGVGEENIFMLMSDIVANLEDPDNNAQDLVDAGYITKLQGRQEHLLGMISELGGKYNQITMMQDNYALDEEIQEERYSKLVDADIAEATIYWKMAQAMYEATLQAMSQIIQPTLMDFMR